MKMARAVCEQGGSVTDFTGDSIMALFGVPNALEDAPLRADWGSARRALPPARLAGAPMGWTCPASRLGSAPAARGV
jgi:class 3 adenylate cyclase